MDSSRVVNVPSRLGWNCSNGRMRGSCGGHERGMPKPQTAGNRREAWITPVPTSRVTLAFLSCNRTKKVNPLTMQGGVWEGCAPHSAFLAIYVRLAAFPSSLPGLYYGRYYYCSSVHPCRHSLWDASLVSAGVATETCMLDLLNLRQSVVGQRARYDK